MSLIRQYWSTLGWLLGVAICFVVALWFFIFLLLIVIGLVMTVIGFFAGQPEALAVWALLTWWLDVALPIAIAIVVGLCVLALGILLLDALLNFVVNIFRPGVSSWSELGNDLSTNLGRLVDGVKEGVTDVGKAAARKLKEGIDTAGKIIKKGGELIDDGIDWIKSWFKPKPKQ